MPARTILYTGKGGVGKTSVAACTARRLAGAGRRTLVLSTDPAHSLADSLGVELGGEPRPAGEGLWGQQVDAQGALEAHWGGVREWLAGVLVERGVERISAEELAVPPGMDELFSLLALGDAHASDRWDAIVVDCAPTGETLRMLSFPDIARWWLDRVVPAEEQLLAAAGPLARMLLDLELPGDAAFGDLHRLARRLIAMNDVLRDRAHTTVRLVMTPDRMVIGEAMRTFTYLNLYGYLTDAVVVNRVFPAGVGAYFAAWRDVQEQHLALVGSAFAPVPILRAPFFEREVIGGEMLDRLADALFAAGDPAARMYDEVTQVFALDETGARVQVKLPFTAREDVTVKKVGHELVVRVHGVKRTIALPSAIAPMRPRGARLRDDTLEITFDATTVTAPSP